MPVKDLDILKAIILKEAETETLPQGFEEDPMGFILKKYPGLNEVMTYLMTKDFKEFVDAIFVVAPKPTTFKILLHNGQYFFLQFMGKTYQATVSGKNYYLMSIGEKERCMLAIARILRYGNPMKTKGPEGAEQGTRPEGEEGGAGGEASAEVPEATPEAGGEELKESEILQEILKQKMFEKKTDASLKSKTISAVKSIENDNDPVFDKVLKTLESGNIDDVLKKALEQDKDSKKYTDDIVDKFIKIQAPIKEKQAFIEKYKKGDAVDTEKLIDGQRHSFSEIVGSGFDKDFFKSLCGIRTMGVGPGELALAIYSPKISFQGQKSGGGDIHIGNKKIEVKGSIQKGGGRFVDMRKSKIDSIGIQKAIKGAVEKNGTQDFELPKRINSSTWISEIRPKITDQKDLESVAEKIKDYTFPTTKNSPEANAYKEALIKSNSRQDLDSIRLKAAYNDYKAYSNFDGVLLLDVPTETMQYIEDVDSLEKNVSTSTTYIFATDSEMMPQVKLKKDEKKDQESTPK